MEDSRESSSDRLLSSLREFVAEVPPRAETEAGAVEQPMPGWRDLLWLGVFIADVVLVYELYPPDLKGPLEFLGKFLPWLFGGLFVVANDWFRDRLLSISRSPRYRTLLVVILLLGVPVMFRVIPMHAEVKPAGTAVIIDDKAADHHRTIWVTLQPHRVRVTNSPMNTVGEARDFTLSRWQVLWGSTIFGATEYWSPLFKFDVDPPAIGKVRITRTDGEFDVDFQDPGKLESHLLILDDDHIVILQAEKSNKTYPIVLPYGTYTFSEGDCVSKPVSVPEKTTYQFDDCQKPEGH
jgi:hypothetical protein